MKKKRVVYRKFNRQYFGVRVDGVWSYFPNSKLARANFIAVKHLNGKEKTGSESSTAKDSR